MKRGRGGRQRSTIIQSDYNVGVEWRWQANNAQINIDNVLRLEKWK